MQRRFARFVWVWGMVLAMGPAVTGWGQAKPEVEPYREVTAEEVQAAKGRVRERLAALLARLSRDPAEVREGWQSFLLTDALAAQLAAEEPEVKEVRRVLARLQSDKAGMEFSPVLALRHAFQEYWELARVRQDSKSAAHFAEVQGKVREALTEYAKTLDPYQAVEVGRGMGEFRRARQAPRLLAQLDEQFGRDNLHVQVSHRLMAAGIEQEVDEQSHISDSMLGVSVQGTVRMVGRVSLALEPQTDFAALRLQLSGRALSSNVGQKRSVSVYSSGVTSVEASKHLRLNDLGFFGSPALASCATSTSIDDIHARCGLVERLAWKKAQQSQGQAESIASSKAETRVAQRMDEQAAEMLDKANDSFQQKFRRPLTRRDGLPRSLRMSTTAERLAVRWQQRSDAQLAAATDPPAMAGKSDVEVRVHPTYVANLSEAAIGGVKLTDERLVKMLEDSSVEVPEELRIDETKDAWSITFAQKAPFSLVIGADGQVTITVEGSHFTRNDTQINDAMRMSATYKFERTPQGAKLVRQGDVVVDFVSRKAGLRVGFKPFMRRKFEALFKPEFAAEGIKLPGRWEKAGKLFIADFTAAGEWLSLAWDLKPAEPPAAKSAASAPAAGTAVPTAVTAKPTVVAEGG